MGVAPNPPEDRLLAAVEAPPPKEKGGRADEVLGTEKDFVSVFNPGTFQLNAATGFGVVLLPAWDALIGAIGAENPEKKLLLVAVALEELSDSLPFGKLNPVNVLLSENGTDGRFSEGASGFTLF